jgi:hypothetical protein
MKIFRKKRMKRHVDQPIEAVCQEKIFLSLPLKGALFFVKLAELLMSPCRLL